MNPISTLSELSSVSQPLEQYNTAPHSDEESTPVLPTIAEPRSGLQTSASEAATLTVIELDSAPLQNELDSTTIVSITRPAVYPPHATDAITRTSSMASDLGAFSSSDGGSTSPLERDSSYYVILVEDDHKAFSFSRNFGCGGRSSPERIARNRLRVLLVAFSVAALVGLVAAVWVTAPAK
ncbi:hypothetical protein BJ742DRAFT_846013 [Cladochytrium replicatum]|nr:hypothetical protein BJ742DRAFT_846013 [Cladochytrium replicatum]